MNTPDIDWDALAEEADESLPAAIGRLKRLHEEGKLTNWLVTFAYSKEGDTHQRISYYESDAIGALGLAEYVKISIAECLEDGGDG